MVNLFMALKCAGTAVFLPLAVKGEDDRSIQLERLGVPRSAASFMKGSSFSVGKRISAT